MKKESSASCEAVTYRSSCLVRGSWKRKILSLRGGLGGKARRVVWLRKTRVHRLREAACAAKNICTALNPHRPPRYLMGHTKERPPSVRVRIRVMAQTFFVLGITGHVGGAAARQLLEER